MPQMKKEKQSKKKEKEKHEAQNLKEKKQKSLFFFKQFFKTCIWFFLGIILGIFFLVSFTLIIFQFLYNNRVYPNIFVAGVNVSGKTKQEVVSYFDKQNQQIGTTTFTFT